MRKIWLAFTQSVIFCLLLGCSSQQPPAAPENAQPADNSTQAPVITPTEKPTRTSTPTTTPIPATPTETQPAATPEIGIGSTLLSEKDWMTLLYVPGGPFQMGSDRSSKNSYPLHTIYLESFWIDQTEVTNAMYTKCVTDGACQAPQDVNSHNRLNYFTDERYADYPVLFVPWNEASAYCRWAGRELPTEAQWEKAARGTDSRLYPWGDQAPSKELLNFDTPLGDTKKVGVYPAGASPYGALDMAGNAWEWVADWYEERYYQTSPEENPTGPQYGYERVERGGSWGDDMSQIRTFVRRGRSPIEVSNALSFRCALGAE